jgi:hypothetical protein
LRNAWLPNLLAASNLRRIFTQWALYPNKPGYMDAEKKLFIQDTFIQILRKANPQTTAKWGKMSFQHMVEHMVLSVKSANGKIKTEKIFTPPEKIPAFKEFLMSNKEFKENTRSPSFPADPLPLHFKTVNEGIDKLQKELADFFVIYEDNPGLSIQNPVFGDLDYEEAVQLLHKHALHHAKQFGLIKDASL